VPISTEASLRHKMRITEDQTRAGGESAICSAA
jgi:hypothetical protein